MLPARWLVGVLTRCVDSLAKLRRRLMPRHFAAIELGTVSWVAQSVAAFCELDLPQALANGPQSPAQLAAAGFGDERMLGRLLRALAAYDVVRYEGAGRFALGHVGKALTGSASAAPLVLFANAAWHMQAYAQLAQTVRTGKPGFELAHGVGLFDFLGRDAAAGKLFDEAMRSVTMLYAPPLAHAYDFSKVHSVVDVGGGTGLLLQTVLQRFAHLQACVFELPAVAQRGRAQSGLVYAEGDIFTDVPPQADCYILSHILHDWDDDSCAAILRNIRAAMTSDSRLIVYELIAPPPNNAWTQDRITDLEMMAVLTGKERTRKEFEQLLMRCGLRLRRVIRTAAPEAVIECVPAGSPNP